MQLTLQTLSEEVEFLSKANESFLKELRIKDFYGTYKQTVDELNKLREAHTVLIGMIQNHHLSIGSYSTPNQTIDLNASYPAKGRLYMYKNSKYQRNCSTPNTTGMRGSILAHDSQHHSAAADYD